MFSTSDSTVGVSFSNLEAHPRTLDLQLVADNIISPFVKVK